MKQKFSYIFATALITKKIKTLPTMIKRTLTAIALLLTLSTFVYGQDSLNVVKAENTTPTNDRNTLIIGYQIGGQTLIGVDYEIRLHDFVGIHLGGGLSGYTAGIKIHTNASKTSSFFNINLKDGGFGMIQTVGVEYGGRWVFNKEKSDFGLAFQIGFGAITSIDSQFETDFFDGEAPPTIMTIGVGFGF